MGPEREAIQLVFTTNAPKLFAMYQRQLRIEPDSKGYIYIYVSLKQSGEVETVEVVKTNMESSAFVQETIDSIRSFRFPGGPDQNPGEFCYPLKYFPR